MRSFACFRAIGALCLLAAGSSAPAITCFVNANATQSPFDGSSFAHGFKTLQEGVDNAVSRSADEIADVRVAEGLYLGTTTVPVRNEDLQILGGYAGTDPDTRDPAKYPTILDANAQGSALNVDTGPIGEAHLGGLTFINGSGTAVNGVMKGGAIIAQEGYLDVEGCDFHDNAVAGDQGSGGAIEIGSGQLYVISCVFKNNGAAYGGAVALDDTSVGSIVGSDFENNGTVSGATAVGGGAVFIAATAGAGTVRYDTFGSNTANAGGAICVENAQGQYVGFNSFTGNHAGYGGGVYVWQGSVNSVMGNAFDENKADSLGAAIYMNASGDTTNDIADNVFTNNTSTDAFAEGFAAGVVVAGGGAVVNNTLEGNTGTAISLIGPSITSNNIIAFNGAGVAAAQPNIGPFHANDVYSNSGAAFTGMADPTGADGNVSADPEFEDRAGGDRHLSYGSPCINTGNNADAAAHAGEVDIDQNGRFNARVDIGADEFFPYLSFDSTPLPGFANEPFSPQPVITVRDLEGHHLPWPNGSVTLSFQQSISGRAIALSGDVTEPVVNGTITFHNVKPTHPAPSGILTVGSSTFGGISGNYSVPIYTHRAYVKPTGNDTHFGDSWDEAVQSIPAAIALTKGPAAEVWAAAGTYTGPVTIPTDVMLYGSFTGGESTLGQRDPAARTSVIAGSGFGPAVSFNAGANGNGLDGFHITGGAGQMLPGIPTSFTEGGGVEIQNASPTISHNLITGNHADVGGGICVHGGSPRIIANVITGNATGGITTMSGGGGITIWPSSSPVVMDNVIAKNSGVNGGAGALSVSSPADIHNNTIVDNHSDPGWGDILISGGSPAFTNNIIANHAGIEQTGGTPAFNYNDYVPGSPVQQMFTIPPTSVGNLDIPPLFTNSTLGDYHLTDFRLVDIGNPAALLPRETDMDGQPRLMGTELDLGADEIPVAYTEQDAALALEIAGGTHAASLTDTLRLDWLNPTGVDVGDAALLARRVAGLEPNP